MPQQPDLFADEIAAAVRQQAENNSVSALKAIPQGTQLSPSQQRFNRMLDRIEKLKKQLHEMQTISDAHRPVYHQTIAPLRASGQALTRELVLWLDKRLARKGLSNNQQRIAATILCHLSEPLAIQGDVEMQTLHDKHSLESLAQKEQAAVSSMREMMEDVLGESFADDDSFDNLHDALNIGMKRLREAAEAEEEKRQQAKQRKKKPTAAQLKAAAEQQEANTTLRKVFRQLASALHPDRESDPNERDRKTVLMSEANAAYERRDLITLLQIQLRVELADHTSLARMAEEKIASLLVLLKQQAQELEDELYHRHQVIRQEFGLNPYQSISKTSLQQSLKLAENSLKRNLAAMEEDLQKIQNDQYLKRWLKDQDQLFNDDTFLDELGDWLDPYKYR